MSHMLILWIVVLVVTLAIEAETMGITTVWFSGGAVLAIVLELLGAGAALQILVFLTVSLVLLFFTRPIALKHFNRQREKTNLDSLIGKQAVVTFPIHNLKETGKVVVDGKEWSARSKDAAAAFEKEQIVRIVSIEGVKLIVE